MTQHLLFKISKSSFAKAKKFLIPLADAPLYQIEEHDAIYLGGFFHRIPQELPEYVKDFEILDENIDWTKQWHEFSPHMQGELMVLDLKEFGFETTIKLEPGPGFGDLSHPTTKLCLKYLATHARNQIVIDVGSGSGILSVAAFAFGAKKVISLEIDETAVLHTKKNLRLNHFSDEHVFHTLPDSELIETALCVINMTFHEQMIALANLDALPKHTTFISSGILTRQKKEYLDWAKSMSLVLKQVDHLEIWSLFAGTKKN